MFHFLVSVPVCLSVSFLFFPQSTAAGVLTTNTKTSTRFSFPELHANKLINQSLHVVHLNIDRYDMIIGRDLIKSLGIDIHGGDMTIHWDDASIPWRDIDSTTKDLGS